MKVVPRKRTVFSATSLKKTCCTLKQLFILSFLVHLLVCSLIRKRSEIFTNRYSLASYLDRLSNHPFLCVLLRKRSEISIDRYSHASLPDLFSNYPFMFVSL